MKTSRCGKPKVRSGCTTCKIRRVKCDEAKPECLRCFRSSRKCDGYAAPRLDPVALTSASSSKETRALEFPYHNTAPQLPNCLHGSFWRVCVQQLALTEPSIRYAIVAISTMHEAKTSSLESSSSVGSAIQYYNRAISAISKRASTGIDALPVVIVICIAFIYFEGLWGRVDVALGHLKSGINLTKSQRDIHGEPVKPWGQSYNSFQSAFFEEELAPMLSSVSMSITEFSQTDMQLHLNPVDSMGIPVLAEIFNNISEAGAALLDLNNAGLGLFRAAMGLPYGDNSMSVQSYRLRDTIMMWNINFERLVTRNDRHWTTAEETSIKYL